MRLTRALPARPTSSWTWPMFRSSAPLSGANSGEVRAAEAGRGRLLGRVRVGLTAFLAAFFADFFADLRVDVEKMMDGTMVCPNLLDGRPTQLSRVNAIVHEVLRHEREGADCREPKV